MTAIEPSLSGPDAGELPNLDPRELARMALGSACARKWVLRNLRYVVRHHRQSASVIELTGAHIYLLGGAKELRRVAETAQSGESDCDGQVIRMLLLSGFWRSDEVRHTRA